MRRALRMLRVRASPRIGPNGSANPVQKTSSAGRRAWETRAPTRGRFHNNHAVATSAVQTTRKVPNKGVDVATPTFSNGPLP